MIPAAVSTATVPPGRELLCHYNVEYHDGAPWFQVKKSQIDRVGEDTFEMYLRYRYIRGCIFCIFQILRYRYH